MKKYLNKITEVSTIFCVLLLGNLIAIAETENLPQPEELGLFMGRYMCQSLIETGTMDDDEIMEEFANNLGIEYGEEQSILITNKLDEVFSSPDISNDEYGLSLMKGVFSHIINDQDCFKSFLKSSVN